MIDMPIGQLKRSALRRSLQTCFFDSILAILINAPKRGKLETRYAASWKWVLTICALLQQGVSDNSTTENLRVMAKKLGIHSNALSSHMHHKLFMSPGVNSMSDNALSIGLDKLSNQSLLDNMNKKYRQGIEQPWEHILPEDIGSCFEIVKEIEAIEDEEGVKLVYSEGRRKGGIHHTPFDVTRHMANLSLSKVELRKETIPEDFVVCDLAVGAGAFLVQFARLIANISGTDIGIILEKHVIGFDIDSNVLQLCSLCFHLERRCPNVDTFYHLHNIDTIGRLDSRGQIKSKIAEMCPSSDGNPTITTGNPPYVKVKAKDYSHLEFRSNKCGNLSAYFVEQAIEITKIGKIICQIVPQSLVQSGNMETIRKILLKRCSSIYIEAYC